jgi:hypothetical protein
MKYSISMCPETLILEEVMKKVAVLLPGILVFICSLSLRHVCAQQFYGTISGTVTDPTGAAVPNAAVKVTNVDTNTTAALKTNGAGVYVANNLVIGTYRVEAEAPGFKRVVAERIRLDV